MDGVGKDQAMKMKSYMRDYKVTYKTCNRIFNKNTQKIV